MTDPQLASRRALDSRASEGDDRQVLDSCASTHSDPVPQKDTTVKEEKQEEADVYLHNAEVLDLVASDLLTREEASRLYLVPQTTTSATISTDPA